MKKFILLIPAVFMFMLSQVGLANAAAAVNLNPASLAFGNQAVGTTSAARTVTLTNTGDITLNITSIAGSGDFAVTNTCGATLATSGSCTISVTFSPTAAGNRTGQITVTTDAASSPDTVALSGTGTGAAAAIRPVVIEGEAAPGFAAGFVFYDLAGDRIAINNSGLTVFTATVRSGFTYYETLWRENSGTAELITRTEENAPGISGDVLFKAFRHPNINDAGQVAFVGLLQGSDVEMTSDIGVWKGTPGSLLLVACEGDTVPGSSGDTFGEKFSASIGYDVAFNNAGRVAFYNNLNGASTRNSVWQENASGLTMLAVIGGAVPGFEDATYGGFWAGIPFNNNGHLAFFPNIVGTFDWTTFTGAYLVQKAVNGSVTTKYTGYKTAAPGVAGGVFQQFPTSRQNYDMNASGQLVFQAGLEYGGTVDWTNNSGIWSDASGSLALVARRGSHAPGTPAGAVFDLFNSPLVMNDSGQVAFRANLKTGVWGIDNTNNTGIWLETGGVLNLIARAGDRAPGTPDDVVFNTQFNNYAINSAGQVYFQGTLTGPGIDYTYNADGIWLYDPSNGLTLVVREGDEVTLTSGETVTFIDITPNAGGYYSGGSDGRARYFNNNGEIVFGATVTPDYRQGFFISNLATNLPVPDIKANGSDGVITVSSGSPVSIAVALDAGDQAGQNADWWVLKYGPDGWSYLGISGGSLLFLPGLSVTYQGPLFNFPSFGIFNTSGLPVGTHIFCFGVDLNMNGSIDTSPLYYDWVQVTVTSGAGSGHVTYRPWEQALTNSR